MWKYILPNHICEHKSNSSSAEISTSTVLLFDIDTFINNLSLANKLFGLNTNELVRRFLLSYLEQLVIMLIKRMTVNTIHYLGYTCEFR